MFMALCLNFKIDSALEIWFVEPKADQAVWKAASRVFIERQFSHDYRGKHLFVLGWAHNLNSSFVICYRGLMVEEPKRDTFLAWVSFLLN
jgi:hypothetical protein